MMEKYIHLPVLWKKISYEDKVDRSTIVVSAVNIYLRRQTDQEDKNEKRKDLEDLEKHLGISKPKQ